MPGLALFDFDGTITSHDTFTPFIHYAVDPRRLAVGKLVLAPLIAAYKLGALPGRLMRASVAWVGFRGRSAAQVRHLGFTYSRERLGAVVRTNSLDRIRWHQAQGDTVAVVSASLDVYLTDWCAELGVDLVCTELAAKDGVLTGRYRRGDCSGSRKAERILERYDLQSYDRVYAYGDTKEDDAMLRLASDPHYRWTGFD